jgi:hypothetical protein
MYKCPTCGSTLLRVVGRVLLDLTQEDDGNIQTEATGDHDWDNSSFMMCYDCGEGDEARRFDTDYREPDESMDGDAASALASAGLGTDEDYGGGDEHY